jgi:hypothetical protein
MDFLCEYTVSGICIRTPRCRTQCAYHDTTNLASAEQKLDYARRLVQQVNDSERGDPELSWRPWQVVRKGDMRA